MARPRFPFSIPTHVLRAKLRGYLQQDLPYGDITSGLIPTHESGSAFIFAKSKGVLAGAEEAVILFRDSGLEVVQLKEDGEPVVPQDRIMQIRGDLREILMVERTALNILMRMSSIAASTYDYVRQIQELGLTARIAATRKTTPGFGFFEKKAVYLGGGDPHRWDLSDMVLLKDTHLKYYKGDIAAMLEAAKAQTSFSKKVELEIEDPVDFPLALRNGADIIMLDNMQPDQIREILKKYEVPGHLIIEVSGNITAQNFLDYARAGADVISTSATIFQPHIWVDYSLRLA